MIKLRLPRKWRRQTPIFMAGAVLFLIGVIGFGIEAWLARVNQLEHLVSEKVVVLAKAPTASLPGVEFDDYLPDWVNSDVENWIGNEVALLALDQREYALGARYDSKSALKDWMETVLTEDETFTITKTAQGELFTPEFSSELSFLVTDRWVFMARGLATIQTIFDTAAPLSASAQYRAVSKQGPWQLYVNGEQLLSGWETTEPLTAYGPLIQALGQAVPAFNLAGKSAKEEIWEFDSAFVIPSRESVSVKKKNTTIPDLAYYAPNQVLFFLNGQDLYQRYLDTRTFLGTLNPQFELIFDGLWEAQITRWFGDQLDFEQDFLQAISGPYALMFDYSNGLDWLFVTESEFGEEVVDLIKTAQGQFSPRVEVIELPDGTTREELVATAPGAVNIKTVSRNDLEYLVAKSTGLNQKELVFKEDGKNFLLSSDRDFLESALQAKQSESTSLASNTDFRQAVLFKLGQAESFGFLNMDKFRKATEPLTIADPDPEKRNWWQTLGNLPVRNIIFSRRLEQDRVLVKWLLFGN